MASTPTTTPPVRNPAIPPATATGGPRGRSTRRGSPETARTPVQAPGVHPAPSRATTGHRAPTEAEIRAAIGASIEAVGFDDALNGALVVASGPVANPAFLAFADSADYAPDVPDPGDLWTDLRHSEAARLHELAGAAWERAKARCREAIIEEYVAAGVAFAAEFPDAPRPEPAA